MVIEKQICGKIISLLFERSFTRKIKRKKENETYDSGG